MRFIVFMLTCRKPFETEAMNKSRYILVCGMVLAAAFSRLIPHPPNFTPVAALALFGGASFGDKRAALCLPWVGLFFSDLVLGFYPITPIIYASFALIAFLGMWLRKRPGFWNFTLATAAGAVLFFVLTNFGVWVIDTIYPKTEAGLAHCFVAAIPFFWNTLASDVMYTALLFGAPKLAEKQWPAMAEAAPSIP